MSLKLLTVLFMTASTIATSAQTPLGVYRLSPSTEMASGFKFKNDGTFEFFFVYGAVDRSAHGRFHVENGKVVLAAQKQPGKDFTVKSQEHRGDGTSVKITDANNYLVRHVLCIFKRGTNTDQQISDEEGLAHSNLTNCDSILVIHTLFPDEPTTIKPSNNFITLTLNPSLAEVSFHHFVLTIGADKSLSGSLPYLFERQTATFIKEED